jgi:predicted phage terminase large subunit-like protein
MLPNDSDTQEAAMDFWEREQAALSLAQYARRVIKVEPATHHRIICDAIDRLMEDDYDELIVVAPPGSAKSTYTSIAFAAYFLGRWNTRHVLTASYSSELAEKWGRKVRGIIDSAEHQRVFPESRLSVESKSAGRWATSAGGEFYAAGVGSGILGFRADLAIIDDPISGFEEANSLTQLQKVHEWYETDFVTRLKPNAKTILICQRLSRNDLAGYLIDRNVENPTRRQHVLKIRMEAVADEVDPIGRQPGERLWPEWYTAEMLEDAKRDDYKWRTLYQQDPPSDDGSWVASAEIKLVDIVPQPAALSHYLLTDLALSVNTGDYSVHIVCGVDEHGNVYVVDAWRARVSPEVTVDKHVELTSTYNPLESLIDDDNAAKVYVQLLAQKCRSQQVAVPWKMLPMRGQDKETRAAALRGMFKRGVIYIKRAEWNRWLVRELLAFPNATGQGVDDGVDALSLIGRRLASLTRAAPATPPKPVAKTIYDVTLSELWEDREHRLGKRRV